MRIKSQLIFFCIFFQSGICSAQTLETIDENSLLVTATAFLNPLIKQDLVNPDNHLQYDFAYQLGKVSEFLSTLGVQRQIKSPGHFVETVFTNAYDEQKSHNKLQEQQGGPVKMLGSSIPTNNLMNKIFSAWKTSAELKAITQATGLKGSPFRLVAITNLMDQAGNFDDRGLPPIAEHPRSLGELHMVYGYVDPIYETTNGRAFPQTFVISYRLPILIKTADGLKIDPTARHEDLVLDQALWKKQMNLWAKL